MKTKQAKKKNKKTCRLCGAEIKGHGNNPWPLADEGECCDACNAAVVAERMRREAELDRQLYADGLEARIREAVSRHVGSNLTEAITKDVLAVVQK